MFRKIYHATAKHVKLNYEFTVHALVHGSLSVRPKRSSPTSAPLRPRSKPRSYLWLQSMGDVSFSWRRGKDKSGDSQAADKSDKSKAVWDEDFDFSAPARPQPSRADTCLREYHAVRRG